MNNDEKIEVNQHVSSEPYLVFNEDAFKDADYVVQDNEGNVVYQGKNHPWVELFNRTENLNKKLNDAIKNIDEIDEFLNGVFEE